MKGGSRVVALVVLVWLATVLQAVAPRFAIGRAQPDFLLLAVAGTSLYGSRVNGAVLGFFAGLAHGAIAGMGLGFYVVSRTLAGFGAAWSRTLSLEQSPWIVAITTLIATFCAQSLQMFLPPPRDVGTFLADTILTATYNGVLAIPLYSLLNKLLGPARM